MIACVPDDDAASHLDPPPDGVRLIVWDGRGQPPDDVADTEFLLPGYMRGGDADATAALADAAAVSGG